MFQFGYINPFYWLIAVAGVFAWARFTLWVATDVKRLPHQSDVQWKIVLLLSLLLITLLFLLVPWFIVSLIVNLLVAGGVFSWYAWTRVQELGPEGNLFKGAMQTVSQASRNIEEHRAARAVTLSYLDKNDSPVRLAGNDPAHASLGAADEMMVQAMARNAENIDLNPAPNGYDLRITVDGVLASQSTLPRDVAESIIQAIKLLAGLTIEERRRPQQGAFKTRDAESNIIKWTVRTSGSTAGEKLSLASNESGRWTFGLDALGLPSDQFAALKEITSDRHGVVIVASPRQTGRTATLYALVRQHDAFTSAVHSLEVNPQAEIEGVTLHRFDPRGPDLNYAKALQSVVLKDPGVLLTAQCPDARSAEIIARYALEDHRVYVGLPAHDTMAALEIWLQLIPDRQVAVNSLRAIVSQRLIRLLCPTCRIPFQPDEATLRKLNLPIGRNLQSFKANTEGILDSKGARSPCPNCSSIGYRGRTGIFEILVLTDEMRKELLAGATLKQVLNIARKNNMSLLVEQGIRKFATGLTSINEVLRVLAPEKAASGASGVLPAQK